MVMATPSTNNAHHQQQQHQGSQQVTNANNVHAENNGRVDGAVESYSEC